MDKEKKEYLKAAFSSNPIKIFKKISNTYSGHVATRRTQYVLKIILGVYIPLILLWALLFCKFNYLSLPFLFLVLSSGIPFAEHILIDLSEKKYPEIRDEVYAMQSCKDCYYLKHNLCSFASEYINDEDPSEFVACERFKVLND